MMTVIGMGMVTVTYLWFVVVLRLRGCEDGWAHINESELNPSGAYNCTVEGYVCLVGGQRG